DAAAVDASWQAWCERCRTDADLAAQTGLIEATLAALPEILDGRRLATEIVFPDSGMSRLEGVYGRNTLADYYNGVVAQVVAAGIERQRQRDPQCRVRILEIGAGTGGTSQVVFERLRSQAASIQEYAYTDISRSFLMHAQERFGAQVPYLRCELFNVEQALEGQAIVPGSYDIVIAANVLHATRDMGVTLRHAKALLRSGGLLVLNEISQFSLYTHLTFGLLDGWWRFEDEAVRIAGTPALSPASWQRVMEGEGFRAVQFPAQAAHGLGQQVVVGQSDGMIRVAAATPLHTVTARVSTAVRRSEGRAVDEQREAQVRRTIAEAIAVTLKLSPDRVDVDEPFADYGLDSILGVNAVRLIAERLGIELRATVLFDYRTVAKLAAHILAVHRLGDDDTAVPADDGRGDEPAAIAPPLPWTSSIAAPFAPALNVPVGRPEPIAIVGLSARYPRSEDAAQLWEHLARGTDLLEEGDSATMRPGAIADMDRFDAPFFNISGVEATYMDPQQRLFLEASWKALEDAGYVGDVIE
uniref:beta-ketoacyl synthase N-terminal-like domain-containing protein n=1 Tax=Tychonema sp. BBK16 TaxID=2699888 RepID=UPI001F2C458E